jgi:hypothetical protein
MADSSGDGTITGVVSVLLAVVGVAILALLVSQHSNTPGVFKSFGSAIQQMLCVALSPVSGGGCSTSVTSTISFG